LRSERARCSNATVTVVAMTRTGRTYAGGNIERARFCNVRHAALMIRIHADGAADSSLNGIKTLVPALTPRLDG